MHVRDCIVGNHKKAVDMTHQLASLRTSPPSSSCAHAYLRHPRGSNEWFVETHLQACCGDGPA